MKYLIPLLFVFSGCSNNLKVGDCYNSRTEFGVFKTFKILKVGKYSYESEDREGNLYQSDSLYRSPTDCWF